MNSQDRSWMTRIEGKLDKVVERGIRTEDKLNNHIGNHDSSFRKGTVITAIVVSVVTLVVNVAARMWN